SSEYCGDPICPSLAFPAKAGTHRSASAGLGTFFRHLGSCWKRHAGSEMGPGLRQDGVILQPSCDENELNYSLAGRGPFRRGTTIGRALSLLENSGAAA